MSGAIFRFQYFSVSFWYKTVYSVLGMVLAKLAYYGWEIVLSLVYCFIACLSEHLLFWGLYGIYIADLEYTTSMAE